jgi:S1-C subfamily serine protease
MLYTRLSFIVVFVAGNLLLPLFVWSASGVLTDQGEVLDRQEIAAIAKPSVVRIVQHVKGEAVIPALKMDLKNLTVEVDPSRPPTTVPVDQYLSGSGFIVSPNGYILTNSHVVSLQSVKLELVSATVLPTLFESAMLLSQEEAEKIFEDEEVAFEFSKRVFEYVSEQSRFQLDQRLVVLNPASQKEKIPELMDEGFVASIVSVNDSFYADDRDVALIKIEQDNLPALPLGDSRQLNTGKMVYIFGFPATAEFNQRNPMEATFTQGVISAFKDSQEKDFKVIQTDAKVSQGSSGGPLLNERGEAIGMITFQSDELQRESGDNFAFALSMDTVHSVLPQETALFESGGYAQHFRQGATFLRERRCREALREFDAAQAVTADLWGTDQYLSPFVSQCEALVTSGQSADTLLERIAVSLEAVTLPVRYLVGILVTALFTLLLLVLWLMWELRKDEREIQTLEDRLKKDEVLAQKDHAIIEKMTAGDKNNKT